MKKKPARKGRFFHALNVPRALCQTPRKGPHGQGLGGLLPAERRERELFGRIPGCSFRAAVPRRRSFARKNSGSGARFLAAQVLPANAAFLHAAAAGIMRTGTPVFRPGMGEGAAQRAGGTRPFLRRNAASLQAAAAGLMRAGRPCSVPGWGKSRRKERAGRALFSAGMPLLFTPRSRRKERAGCVIFSAGTPLLFKPQHPRQPCAEQTAKYFKKPQKGRKKS